MATGDILSVLVPSATAAGLAIDGSYIDVDIDSFTTGMDVDFGSGFGSQLDVADLASAKIVVTIVSEGYTSGVLGTVTRTSVAKSIARQKSPNDTLEDQAITAGGARVRLYLTEPIYVDDRNAGAGTSGTDPTITIAAGAFRNTGGSSELSTAKSDFSITNESTRVYPKVIGQWDNVAGSMNADRVKSDFTLASNCFHKFGIDSVRFDADGQTSSNNENGTSTSMTSVVRSATSLYFPSYQASIPLAGFTQGELIDIRFRAYPVVGDAASLLDTDSFTSAADEILGYTKGVIVCDKSDLLDVFKYVATTGNDTTGTGTSSLPYATIAKAVDDGATIVRLKAGTHGMGSSATRRTTNEWISVEPDTGLDSTNVTVQLTATRTYRCQRLKISGTTVTLAGTTSWADGEEAGNFIQFRDCDFDSSGVGTPTTGPGYRSHGTYFINCTGDMGETGWAVDGFSSSRVACQFDGVVFGASGKEIDTAYRVVGCSESSTTRFQEKAAANIAPIMSQLIFGANESLSYSVTNDPWIRIAELTVLSRGLAFIGNVVEKTGATAAAVVLAGDASVVAASHVLMWHNTIAGERCNLGYNDQGTTGYARPDWDVRFNAFRDFNNKDDTFGTPSSARTGGWDVGYGVGFEENHYEISNFPGEYDGLGLTTGTPGYTDDQSLTGGTAGNGDYTPATGSALLNRVTSGGSVFPFDLYGTAIRNDGTGAAGAIQNILLSSELSLGIDVGIGDTGMARVLDGVSSSDGVASLTAGAVTTFTFAAIPSAKGGNIVTVSNVSGGLCRMTVNGVSPDTTITTEDATSVGFYLNGGNAVYEFDSTTVITDVRIVPFTTDWGETIVTVHRDQS